MLGLDFDSKTDIFSYGVIAAELLGWKMSDGNTFMRRVIPGFGFADSEIMVLDTNSTPPPYITMILECLETDCSKRITTKEILAILKEIEMTLHATKNVGTIFIAKTNLDSLESDITTIEHKFVNGPNGHSDLFSEETRFSSLQRVNKASVISHNIPHRFSIHRSASLVKKCVQCDKHVYFKHLMCDECQCVVHLECSVRIPSFCGLSKSLQTLVSPHKSSLQSAESLLSPLSRP